MQLYNIYDTYAEQKDLTDQLQRSNLDEFRVCVSYRIKSIKKCGRAYYRPQEFDFLEKLIISRCIIFKHTTICLFKIFALSLSRVSCILSRQPRWWDSRFPSYHVGKNIGVGSKMIQVFLPLFTIGYWNDQYHLNHLKDATQRDGCGSWPIQGHAYTGLVWK